MLRAQVARLQGNFENERAWLESVLGIAPDYAGLIANDLINCYRRLGRSEQGLGLLAQHYQQHPTLDVFNVVFRELRLQQGYKPAWSFARQALRVRPSLLGLDRLIEAELASREQGGAAANTALLTNVTDSADLVLLRSLIHKHTQRLDRYACRVCGFEARHYYWQCPGCNSWETYQPRRLEEIK
jgi:lipopolysaccharide biosynthesis regulator YciM